jgi:ABC-2 type transport system ATP-binding protein
MKKSIQVNKLSKQFGSFTAVDNISFNVKEGEVFGFLGANGAGKSTAIRMLCGILNPTSGYMSQKFSLYNDLSVEENINFFGGVYGLEGKKFKERKDWVLQIANLKGKEKLLTSSLPGGIKQRLALGAAVIHEPEIVFLDEPTSGVDPISRRNFWDLINDLSANGTTVFVTTHYLEEAEYCNNITLINAGKIIAEGNASELKTNYIKNKIYEIECERVVDALDILQNENYVDDTSIFGNNIHIIVNDDFKSEEQIRRTLTEKNSIAIKRIDKIVPTLEDVFIHLLDKEYNR